jgi:3-phenylpropionate/trans-cinnamate dioxygenase ferredoxin component
MNEFVAVASVAEFADPDRKLIEIGDRLVVLVHAGGQFFALDDVCTHDGGPLSDGEIDPTGCTIACPRHGAKFDLKTGAAKTMPATKATVAHAVKVEDGRVLVRLAD